MERRLQKGPHPLRHPSISLPLEYPELNSITYGNVIHPLGSSWSKTIASDCINFESPLDDQFPPGLTPAYGKLLKTPKSNFRNKELQRMVYTEDRHKVIHLSPLGLSAQNLAVK